MELPHVHLGPNTTSIIVSASSYLQFKVVAGTVYAAELITHMFTGATVADSSSYSINCEFTGVCETGEDSRS